MLKNTPACQLWPIFRNKTVNNSWQKLDIKIANKILEKRPLRGSVPNFKTNALAVRNLKGKENCENEHRETASFMYNFVQKSNATKQLWWHFIPTSPLNFSHGFHFLWFAYWWLSPQFHFKTRIKAFELLSANRHRNREEDAGHILTNAPVKNKEIERKFKTKA